MSTLCPRAAPRGASRRHAADPSRGSHLSGIGACATHAPPSPAAHPEAASGHTHRPSHTHTARAPRWSISIFTHPPTPTEINCCDGGDTGSRILSARGGRGTPTRGRTCTLRPGRSRAPWCHGCTHRGTPSVPRGGAEVLTHTAPPCTRGGSRDGVGAFRVANRPGPPLPSRETTLTRADHSDFRDCGRFTATTAVLGSSSPTSERQGRVPRFTPPSTRPSIAATGATSSRMEGSRPCACRSYTTSAPAFGGGAAPFL